MKKLILLLLALVTLSITFSSCEKDDDPTPDTTTLTASGSEVTPTNDVVSYTGGTMNIDVISNDGVISSDLHQIGIPDGIFASSHFKLELINNVPTGIVTYTNSGGVSGTSESKDISITIVDATGAYYNYTTTVTVNIP